MFWENNVNQCLRGCNAFFYLFIILMPIRKYLFDYYIELDYSVNMLVFVFCLFVWSSIY